jgi:hypothetical protein
MAQIVSPASCCRFIQSGVDSTFLALARKSMFLAPNRKTGVAIWQRVAGNRILMPPTAIASRLTGGASWSPMRSDIYEETLAPDAEARETVSKTWI